MQVTGRKSVGERLRTRPVVDVDKGVVGGGESDAFRGKLAREPAVAIAIELQAERCPGRHPQIDQSEIGIHEVEIVVQALAAIGPHIGLVGGLVVPGLIGIAGFHRRNDMDEAGMIATACEHFGDHLFFADVALGDVLDRDPGLCCQRRGALPHPIA